MIEVATTRGGTRIRIDDQGNLWVGDFINNDPGVGDGLYSVQTCTPVALDGSRIALFEARGGVKLRRLTRCSDGRVTWDVVGSLCAPRDIDAVRRELRLTAPAPEGVRREKGGERDA